MKENITKVKQRYFHLIDSRMVWLQSLAMLFLVSFAACGVALGQDKPFVKANDTIVFMGDSITVASTTPDGFATLIGKSIKTNLPGSNVQIYSAAKGGCGIKYLQTIFDSEVAVHKPAIVVILIGINDVRLVERDQGSTPAEFQDLLKKLVARCQAIGAKAIICSPILRGEKTDGSNQYDDLIKQYVAAGRKVADETSSTFVDLRQLFLERLHVMNPENTEEGHLTKDGVHPNAVGNALIADAILKAWSIPHGKTGE